MIFKGISPSLFSNNFKPLMLIILIISFLGLNIPIMEVDACQYASMSLEMLQTSSFLQVFDLGQAYLDKPPLLFWLSSLSIWLFGNSTWAYKLPSFIMAWISVWALYRLTLIFYSKQTAQFASLIYASSVAFFLFTNDIRTDTLLISFVILAVWQLAKFLDDQKNITLILAAIFIGLAMLAKGPIGLMVPLFAITPHLFLTKKYKVLLNCNIYILPILVILFVLSPMLLGLYQQWGWAGIEFYFWKQSFGRITGENDWKNDASYFYFLHNIIWMILPITPIFLTSLLYYLKNFFKQTEYISFFGFMLPFIALSFSQYKLPHYIYIVVPFASMLSAAMLMFILHKINGIVKWLLIIFHIMISIALLALPILLFWAFHAPIYLQAIYLIASIICIILLVFSKSLENIFFTSILAILLTMFIINFHSYPKLLNYQSSSEVAFYIQEKGYKKEEIYQKNIWWRGFHYYLGYRVSEFNFNKNNETEIYVYTDVMGYEEIKKAFNVSIEKEFEHFNVTRLSLNFLNPKTRAQTLQSYYLLKIENPL